MVVLAIVGLTVGLAAPSLTGSMARERERRQLVELVTLLSAERVEAMRGLRLAELSLSYEGGAMSAERSIGGAIERAGAWPRWSASPAGGARTWGARVRFEPTGRASIGGLRFESSARAGTIWLVEFDPISGAAALRAVTEDAR